ncbi:hypothetical protein [Neisseria yangbaofengii]|uniref:hypothetical protein n=1 Tax=Neisseria yangbaofengii TaxID=2709396 RepID=UPI0013EE1CCF|nr:hypothetical protein [Neisseria yangbaofengii]
MLNPNSLVQLKLYSFRKIIINKKVTPIKIEIKLAIKNTGFFLIQSALSSGLTKPFWIKKIVATIKIIPIAIISIIKTLFFGNAVPFQKLRSRLFKNKRFLKFFQKYPPSIKPSPIATPPK